MEITTKQLFIHAITQAFNSISEEQVEAIVEAIASKYGRPDKIMDLGIEIDNPEPKYVFLLKNIINRLNEETQAYIDAKARQQAEEELARLAKEKADAAFTPVEI